MGGHPNLGPAGSTLPNGGVCFENWAGAGKQKLLLGVGLYIKNLFVGGSPQPKARRVLRSICTGLFHNEIVKKSRAAPGGPASSLYIWMLLRFNLIYCSAMSGMTNNFPCNEYTKDNNELVPSKKWEDVKMSKKASRQNGLIANNFKYKYLKNLVVLSYDVKDYNVICVFVCKPL